MPRIIGVIPELQDLTDCYLRVRASAPWIGVGRELKVFNAKHGNIDAQIPPTPQDRVWEVDFVSDISVPFLPVEVWRVPLEDCNISDIRNFSLSYLHQLEEDNKKLKEEVLAKSQKIFQLGEEINNLKRELNSRPLPASTPSPIPLPVAAPKLDTASLAAKLNLSKY